MRPMTSEQEPLELEAIEARLNAATPGPWYRGDYDLEEMARMVWSGAGLSDDVLVAADTRLVEDADFIAHAPADMRALLGERAEWERRALAAEVRLADMEATIEAALAECDHADTCAHSLNAIYDCDCWRAALAASPSPADRNEK